MDIHRADKLEALKCLMLFKGGDNRMKKILLSIVGFLFASSLVVYLLGYSGQRVFTRAIELPNIETVISQARKLGGTPYDPFMGRHNNFGADLGFIVCSDVPNIAYGLAGYSFKTALKRDFYRNPNAYNSSNGNNPNNPYFHRRSRNLFAYFKSINSLMPISYKANVGDLVFYRKSKKGYISHVALVTEVTSHGYRIMESAPKTLFAQEVDANSPIERGWLLAGFGKVY